MKKAMNKGFTHNPHISWIAKESISWTINFLGTNSGTEAGLYTKPTWHCNVCGLIFHTDYKIDCSVICPRCSHKRDMILTEKLMYMIDAWNASLVDMLEEAIYDSCE